jgi:predicted O-linked N-acetylglucosamine transferase (SPINDLY family)
MSSMTIDQAFQIAMQHHTAGRLADAEGIYRQILAVQPNHSDAMHLLGVLAHQAGKSDAGIELIRQAIALNPGNGTYYNNLGLALTDLRRLDEALTALRRAVQVNPNSAQAHYNLGRALALQGQSAQAIETYRAAIRLNPRLSPALNNLAVLLKEAGKYDEAIATYQAAIAVEPASGDLFSNLGNIYQELSRTEQAIACFQRAVALNPSLAQAWTGYGSSLKDQAKLPEALDAYRKALSLRPDDPRANSNLLYALYFDSNTDFAMIAREHERWDREIAAPLRASIAPHTNDRDPDRRLRIGYVSPDFFNQAESFFVLPLLTAHDRSQVQVHCYASVRRPDDTTGQIKSCCDGWHDVLGMSDEALAEQIRKDQIDILIDLTMHMSFNRILLFARKPAPVQIAWLAYPGTTGLKAMDYRITDRWMDPEGSDQGWSAETPLRLPDAWCVYDSLEDQSSVGPLPAIKNGFVTFGSMNNFCKTNNSVLHLWAKVLAAVPGSRLILGCPEGAARSRVLELFAGHGIAAQRIEFSSPLPRPKYLELYNRIDIALDPFPYNGITTTCDALWMGTPVLTFAGVLPAARAGMSLLNTVGLPQWVAHNPDEFVGKAVGFAADLVQLSSIRASLRERMRQTPLTDAPRFARNMEAAYRSAWRDWCQSSRS